MGARAGKYKLGVRVGIYKLARAGRNKLGTRVGKHELGPRTGKGKYKNPIIT